MPDVSLSPSVDWKSILEGVEASEPLKYELPPAGPYTFSVVSGEERDTTTGKKQLSLRLRIEEGPQKGKTVFANWTISPENKKAMGIFLRNLLSLGVSVEWMQNSAPSYQQIIAVVTGAVFKGSLKHREYNGRTSADVFADEFIRKDAQASSGLPSATPVFPTPAVATPVTPVAPVAPVAVEEPATPVIAAPTPSLPPAVGNPFRAG